MNYVCSYTRQEVLTVVAEHAGKTLPPNKEGVLCAKFLEDGSIEVFFTENKEGNTKTLS